MSLEMTDATHQHFNTLALVPESITDWVASTWILTAIGDALFSLKSYEKARQALLDVIHCTDAIGNPFIHLRLGEVQFEMGNHVYKAHCNSRISRYY